MRTSSIDRATKNLVKWAARGEWESVQKEFYAAHLEPVVDDLAIPDVVFDRLPEEAAGVLTVFIMESFFTTRFGDLNVVDDFLKRRGWRESVPARRYLKALRDSTVSLYEVVDVVPGRSLTVRDLVLGGEAVKVEEKSSSRAAVLWDCLAARIVDVNGKNRFTGAVLHFRHAMAHRLLQAIEKMAVELESEMRNDDPERHPAEPVTGATAREAMMRSPGLSRLISQIWTFDEVMQALAAELPLRNSDDEAIVFCEVRFPLEGDAARVAAVLDGIEEFEREEDGATSWRWLAAGSPPDGSARHREERRPAEDSSEDAIDTASLGHAEFREGALVLSVDSHERAERGRELLASRLDDLVGPALIKRQVPEGAMESLAERRGAPNEPAVLPEQAVQAIHSRLDGDFRRILDDPLPALDGKTLREAAATPDGRERAVVWLKQLENVTHRRAAQMGHRPYDTAWLWHELGIEMPR